MIENKVKIELKKILLDQNLIKKNLFQKEF